jgi:ParB-like chromosome segregation protein Spo0J
VLVAGRYRLEACKLLGMQTIPVRILEVDELKAEIIQIDENLCRSELTELETADCLKRRKEIFEQLYPASKHGGDRKSKGEKSNRQDGELNPDRFTKGAATKINKSERTVQRYVEVASKLNPEAKKAIRETEVAQNLGQLHKLAKQDQKIQIAVARQIGSGEVKSVSQALKLLGGVGGSEEKGKSPEVESQSPKEDATPTTAPEVTQPGPVPAPEGAEGQGYLTVGGAPEAPHGDGDQEPMEFLQPWMEKVFTAAVENGSWEFLLLVRNLDSFTGSNPQDALVGTYLTALLKIETEKDEGVPLSVDFSLEFSKGEVSASRSAVPRSVWFHFK